MNAAASSDPTPDPAARTADRPVSSPTETAGTSTPSLYALVAEQPFFKGLKPAQLQMLADSALVMEFDTGKAILEEGGPANRFYLILQGRVAFEMELDAHGSRLTIQTLGPGDDLGWSWLFPPYAIHFSARALEPTRTIFFYGTRLREQCELDHEFGYQIMKRIAEVATRCLQSAQQSFVAAAARSSPAIVLPE